MLIVAGIFMVGSAIAIPVTMSMVNNARGDSALVMTAQYLETARNRAVSERRNMVITFPTDNSVRIDRVEISGALTLISTMTLEGNQKFAREGLDDTPDDLCNVATDAINFGPAVLPVMFTSDGSLIDSAGDVMNGTIFIVKPGSIETARAVTIFGVTGLMRSWKWRGSQWMQ